MIKYYHYESLLDERIVDTFSYVLKTGMNFKCCYTVVIKLLNCCQMYVVSTLDNKVEDAATQFYNNFY